MKRIHISSKTDDVDSRAQARLLIEALREKGLRPGDFQGDGRQARLSADGNMAEILKVVEENTTFSFRVEIR